MNASGLRRADWAWLARLALLALAVPPALFGLGRLAGWGLRAALASSSAGAQAEDAAAAADLARLQRAMDRVLQVEAQHRQWELTRSELIRDARGHVAAGRFRDAVPLLEAILDRHPSDPLAAIELSRCLLVLGDPARAYTLADTAAIADARELDGFRLRARALAALGRPTEALRDYRHVLRIMPDDRACRVELAETCERAGLPHHALQAWSRVAMGAPAGSPQLERAHAQLRRLAAEILGER